MFKKRYFKIITLIININLIISCGQLDKIDSNSVANEKVTISPFDNNLDTKEHTTSKTPDISVQTPAYDTKRKLSEILSIYEELDVSQSQFKKGYYDYHGIINGNRTIQMSLYPLTNNMVGACFYNDKEMEIILEGKAGAKDIILFEYDGEGNNTGIFKGTMQTVDKIEGIWISADGKNSYPFTLLLRDVIISAQYGKRYAVIAGDKSDKEIENFACDIKSCIVNNNKEQLAEIIAYPIDVEVSGKLQKIQSRDEFMKNYNQIITPDFRISISNACAKYMFVNYRGVMFGEDRYNIWINNVVLDSNTSKLMITNINN